MLNRLLLAFGVLVLGSAASAAQTASSYYVLEHATKAVREVQGDPELVAAKEWQIRLYRNGAPVGGSNHWGLISDKTAAGATKKLEEAQHFQVTFAKWAGTDYRTEELTHFNALGPIAVFDRALPARIVAATERIAEAFRQVDEGRRKIVLILNDAARRPNPYSQVGHVLKEYGETLTRSAAQAHRAITRVEGLAGRSESQLKQELSAFDANWSGFEAKRQAFDAADFVNASSTNIAWMRDVEQEPGGNVGAVRERQFHFDGQKLVERVETRTKVFRDASGGDVAWTDVSVTTRTFDLVRLGAAGADATPSLRATCVRFGGRRISGFETTSEERYSVDRGGRRGEVDGRISLDVARDVVCFDSDESARAAFEAIKQRLR